MKQCLKKQISLVLAVIMLLSAIMIAGTTTASAALDTNDWGTYQLINDGYGYLTANFPIVYPEDYIEIESDEIIEQKIQALMETLTLDEKISLMYGNNGRTGYGYGTGSWTGISRVGLPVIRMYDGPMGVDEASKQETIKPPNALSISSSFDVDAAYDYGALVGSDNKSVSGNMQLGDQIDLIRRLGMDRARDMLGEDWYLSGTISTALTQGIQSENVMACLKHMGGYGNVDEQTLHEMYISQWEMAVKDGGASAVMTAYGTVNGIPAASNSYMLLDVLRGMWNYDGIILTDWGGNYEFSVDNGVTMETASATYNTARAINAALESGLITEQTIDDAVYYNLRALGEIGYLGLVQVSRDGKAAIDPTPPPYIELSETLTGEERAEHIAVSNEKAIELAEKGAVLLKNENNVLPLTQNDKVALIGLGSTYLVAGHQNENSFGALKGLSVSPYDAITEIWPDADITAYVAQDIAGTAIPAEYLYTDASATENGVVRTGTDSNGQEVNITDANIDFVTNSDNYFNAEDGTAFPYGDQGVNYTWTTYLKAPETGTYTMKVESIGGSVSGSIEIAGTSMGIGATTGNNGFGTSSIVSTKTGLNIPTDEGETFGNLNKMADADVKDLFTPDSGWGALLGITNENTADEIRTILGRFNGNPLGNSKIEFDLEEGTVYKVTVTASSTASLASVRDLQVRLAWITPSEAENNYNSAIEAAGTPGTKVVLFEHSIRNLRFDSDQTKLVNDTVAAAKEAGNKIVLLLTSALPMDISNWVDDLDGVLEMWLPGQGGGTAIANILTGKYNPSGKLSVAWPSDFSANQYTFLNEGRSTTIKVSKADADIKTEALEGIYIGYKWYDSTDQDDAVLFDFGHGLSYTDFEYEVVNVEPATTGVDEYGFDFTIKVTNAGDYAGSTAPQIYIAAPTEDQVEGNLITDPYQVSESWTYVDEDGNPLTIENKDYSQTAYFPEIDGVQFAEVQLVGYTQTGVINPGESKEVTIHVNQRALSYWDSSLDELYEREDGTKDKYTVVEGDRTFYLAKSSNEFVEEVTETVEKIEEPVVTVPESAYVNEPFNIHINADKDIIAFKIVNENGSTISIVNRTISYEEEKNVWDITTRLGTAGEGRVIDIYAKTLKGWDDEPFETIVIDILNPKVKVISASFAKLEVKVNQYVEATVLTSSSTTSINVTNENNKKMGKTLVSKSTNKDGTITWVYNMKFGTAGDGKIYQFTGSGVSGEDTIGALTYINVVKA